METAYELYDPEVKKIDKTTTPRWKETQEAKRKLAQMFGRCEKVLDDLFEMKKAAKKSVRLDDVQALSEAINNLKQAQAWMRTISKHRFGVAIDELEGYK